MAEYEVSLTADAERDLEDIVDYIERHDSKEKADHVFERIKETIFKLATLPSRGRIVPELRDVGVTDFREVLFKPYRILYFSTEHHVYVHCIFDGRRNVQDVLGARFLR